MNTNSGNFVQNKPEVLVGTVLMEKNRWTAEKDPSFPVSEWMDRFADDGFDGVELWSFHATKATDLEVSKLEKSPVPVSIFNSYVTFEEGSEADQDRDGEMAVRLGARGIKYNIGQDPDKRQAYMDQVRAWRKRLPKEITLLCECHPGSIIEEPEAALAFFEEAGLENHGIIVHAILQLEKLPRWLDLFGEEVRHVHLQLRDEDYQLINYDQNLSKVHETLNVLTSRQFKGSYTLEFTAGIGDPKESPELLYANALKDLAVLRAYFR